MKNKKLSAFTLVELIVVITILAILGSIAFLSFQGYSSDARDSTRTSDMSNVKTSLELFITKTGNYPNPSNITSITYSGATAWNQGTFGNEPYKQLGDINKLPIDPLTNNEYTYSVTSSKTEYELAGVYEGSISKLDNKGITNKELLNKVNAAQIEGTSKIVGTYNGVQLYVQTGANTFSLFTPSIIGSDITTSQTIDSIVTSNRLVLNGSSKLPSSYITSNFKNGTINLGISDILISTGSLSNLQDKTNGKTLRQQYLTKLQSILTGSSISSNYSNIISLNPSNDSSDIIALSIVNGKGSGGGGVVAISTTQSTPSNSCATQPSITNGTGYTVGSPSSQNQAWTYSSTPGNCTYSCTGWYSGSGCNTNSNPYASCTTAGQVLTASTTYPGVAIDGLQPAHPACDTSDIIVCAGSGSGYTLSACNIGSSIAGTTNSSYGYYFQWGRNKGFSVPSLSTTQSTTITWSSGLNASTDTSKFVGLTSWPSEGNSSIYDNWGDITNTNISRQGPCSPGYHVPSKDEWIDLSNKLSNNFTSIKLPKAGARYYDGVQYYTNPGSDGLYWSSSSISSNMFFVLGGSWPNVLKTHGCSIRCFKN